MDRIKDIASKIVETPTWPDFRAGDTVTVTIKIREGNKSVCRSSKALSSAQRRGQHRDLHGTQNGIWYRCGVYSRCFPLIENIEVNKRGKVRRARIYYLRELTGKAARIKERRVVAKK